MYRTVHFRPVSTCWTIPVICSAIIAHIRSIKVLMEFEFLMMKDDKRMTGRSVEPHAYCSWFILKPAVWTWTRLELKCYDLLYVFVLLVQIQMNQTTFVKTQLKKLFLWPVCVIYTFYLKYIFEIYIYYLKYCCIYIKMSNLTCKFLKSTRVFDV